MRSDAAATAAVAAAWVAVASGTSWATFWVAETAAGAVCRKAADSGGLPGGLGDILGQILRGNPNMRAAGPDAGGFDDLLKQLGPVLGGAAAGGLLSGGLKDLVGDFAQHGYGDAAQSWVSPGDNVPVTPREIEDTFGTETISELAQQLGMPTAGLALGAQRCPARRRQPHDPGRTVTDR